MKDCYKKIDGILVKCGKYPEFTIDGITYHLTTQYGKDKENFHITSDKQEHFYFEIRSNMKGDYIKDSCTHNQSKRTKRLTDLPMNVLKFIKKKLS